MKVICCFILLTFLVASTKSIVEINDLITGGRCGATSQVSGGLILSHQPLTNLPPITNDIVCYFQMRAVKFRQKIRLRFIHFSLSPNDCAQANMTIYDGTSDTDPPIALICPDDTTVLSREYVSTSFWLTLKLQVSSAVVSQIRAANFSAFYVSFTDDRDPCVEEDLELMCNNGRCVYRELECDGYDSCGDGTDEPADQCNNATTVPVTSTSSSAGVAPPTDESLFSDLIPLYAVLSIAFVTLLAYTAYILLSFQFFKNIMVSCLHHCFLCTIKRRRKWKNAGDETNRKLHRKITPQTVSLENLSAVDLDDKVTGIPSGFIPKSMLMNPDGSPASGQRKQPNKMPVNFGLPPKNDVIQRNISESRNGNSINKVNLEFNGSNSPLAK